MDGQTYGARRRRRDPRVGDDGDDDGKKIIDKKSTSSRTWTDSDARGARLDDAVARARDGRANLRRSTLDAPLSTFESIHPIRSVRRASAVDDATMDAAQGARADDAREPARTRERDLGVGRRDGGDASTVDRRVAARLCSPGDDETNERTNERTNRRRTIARARVRTIGLTTDETFVARRPR